MEKSPDKTGTELAAGDAPAAGEHTAGMEAASAPTADEHAAEMETAGGPAVGAADAAGGSATASAAADADPAAGDPAPTAACPSCEDTTGDPDIDRAKHILRGLGFCGHYLHFHGGGRSGQVPILCMLDRCGGMLPQQELGLRFELKPGSLSEILSKMEAAGLIERTRGTKDRRQLFVSLTDAGSAQARLEHEKRDAFRRRAFTALTVEEQAQLATMLDKIRETWEALDD